MFVLFRASLAHSVGGAFPSNLPFKVFHLFFFLNNHPESIAIPEITRVPELSV